MIMSKYFLLLMLWLLPFWAYSQVYTLVYDTQHIGTTAVEATTETASMTLKTFFENPWIEKVSKVQEFFKEASRIVSAVVKNLKMTKELIKVEKDIEQTFLYTLKQIDETENFFTKWKYRWMLAHLYRESLKIFEVFDLATQQNMGIIDDEGRIKLIRQVLDKAIHIRNAMKLVLRRTNKDIYYIRKQQQEFKTYKDLFSFE